MIDRPELIPTLITHGRTVLIPKSEELGKHMKDHSDRNEIWDKSQLGTCSGVLGTIDQLLIDSAIMDEVREKKEA